MPSLTPTPITPDLVIGALDLERTAAGLLPHRLPAAARAQNDDPQLVMAEAQPSGVRLRFRTSATVVELDAVRTKMAYVGAPPRPDGLYDLVVDGALVAQGSVDGGNTYLVDMSTGATELQPGPVGTVRFADLPPGEKQVELWLPWNERTELVELRSDHPVEPFPPTGRRWVHHGSSISHGSFAASASRTWPAIAAAGAGVDLVNLGFGGGALLDPFTARAIRDTAADLVSVKVGINLVNADLMRRRALGPAVHGFLDTIREGHPEVPLLVVGPTYCPVHEETPGPAMPDFGTGTLTFRATGDPAEVAAGRLTLQVVRAELERVVAARAATDPNLAYLDGQELYGPADFEELPLTDGLHPDAATQERIGTRFADRAFGADGPFAGR